jgi:hypothetical protein
MGTWRPGSPSGRRPWRSRADSAERTEQTRLKMLEFILKHTHFWEDFFVKG